jgi:hypothetical protein
MQPGQARFLAREPAAPAQHAHRGQGGGGRGSHAGGECAVGRLISQHHRKHRYRDRGFQWGCTRSLSSIPRRRSAPAVAAARATDYRFVPRQRSW